MGVFPPLALGTCMAAVLCGHLSAQDTATVHEVRQAVVAVRIAASPSFDTSRVAPDWASLRRDFVRCQPRGGDSVCAFTDGKAAIEIAVQLFAADSALVTLHNVFMSEFGRCPYVGVRRPPVLAGSTRESIWARTDGTWVHVRDPRPAVVC